MKNEINVSQNPCESNIFGGGQTSKQQLKDSLTLHEDSCIMGSFKKAKSAFTLAETLIVVAILGVVAVITIPNLIKNQIEAQNRTKVKKAMSVYERVLSKMAIENELKTDSMINTWANEETNCGNTFKYFKASQGQGCMFKTSDGVWWDITNILRPMIYLKREGINSNNKETITGYAKDPNNKEAFILVGRFEDAISALRINDKAFEDANSVTEAYDNGTSTSAKMTKLYGFTANAKNGGGNNDPVEGIFGSPYASLDDFPECSGGIYENCVVISEDSYAIYKTFYLNDNANNGFVPALYGNYWKNGIDTPDFYYVGVWGEPDYALTGVCESPGINCQHCSPWAGTCPEPVDGKYSMSP